MLVVVLLDGLVETAWGAVAMTQAGDDGSLNYSIVRKNRTESGDSEVPNLEDWKAEAVGVK